MADTKKRPAHSLRIGSVRCAIWRNDGANGSWYAVTLERLYKEGDEWKSSASFGRDDLLVAAKVADQAHTWIIEQEGRADSQ